MTVKAFLQEPIRYLSEENQVFVIANVTYGELLPCIASPERLIPVRIERKISLVRDLHALVTMTRVFRRHRFDVVHSLTPKAGLLAMTAAFIAGIDTRVHTFTGQVWATKTGLARWIFKKIDRVIGSLASHVLVDSASQRRFLLDQGVVSARKSAVLHHGSVSGVDLHRFKPNPPVREKLRKSLGFLDTSVVLLFIGRMNRDKGVLDLAAAFATISTDFPDAHLLFVGPDEEGMLAEIKALTAACISRVHFVGFTDEPESYMAVADVLCLPSYREGFGNVVIEAAAVGIPTLGSRIYGVVDAVVDGVTGFLFEVRNIEALTGSLKRLLADKALRESLGENARLRAEREFSSERLAQAWLAYYESLT